MCHVLIIEDEVLVALDLQECLGAVGATSFAFAETQGDAVDEARRRRPDLITSDVRLRAGTGPCAVEAIHRQLGPLPTIFITATPDACVPCDPPAVVLRKPIHEPTLIRIFHELTGT